MVEMMANHLPQNVLTHYSHESAGFISAAEGFVFISGFVAGWTAERSLAIGRPFSAVADRLLSRAAKLYAIYLVVFSFVLLIGSTAGRRFYEWHKLCEPGTASILQVWMFGALLLHLPKFLDIFSMYIFFLLLSPLALYALKRGRAGLVVSVSVALWMLSQFWEIPSPVPLVQYGYFALLAWQLLFVVGIVLGFRHVPHCERKSDSRWVLLASFSICAALFLLRHEATAHLLHLPALGSSRIGQKSTLGVLRLINFAAMAYCCRFALQSIGDKIEGLWLYSKLVVLGQNSLQVFSWSIGLTFLMYLSGESWWDRPYTFQFGLFAVAIIALWAPLIAHKLIGQWRAASLNQTKRKVSVHRTIPAA